MTHRPPRFATWLLERLGFSEANESLIGDLCEQYQNRRSSIWYWREVLAAFAWSTVQDLRSHKLLFLRTVLIGGLVANATAFVATRVLFGGPLRLSGLQWGNYDALTAGVFTTFCGCAAVSGYVVARFHARHRATILAGYVAWSLLVMTIALPWNYQFLSRDAYLSFLPFHVAYGFFGVPVSILLGAASVPKPAAPAHGH